MTAPTQPTLFDQLAAVDQRCVSLPPPRSEWLPSDDALIAVWRAHGIPADLSTVEHGLAMLLVLHGEYARLLAEFNDLLARYPS